ncbi:cysteine hydrolase [Paenibacillus oleatilyticus]|uniref:cysteine hydrolase n=1 Tax=Paenibacillus oleatilyticus TaxID=2594886 RepID=UPI001C1FDC09|nr:cysteine hydrolase [Paenibacillus oleatilyticus]MBU7318396.1 isochorismatase family protein [Paenibacillus oleatilyticus]
MCFHCSFGGFGHGGFGSPFEWEGYGNHRLLRQHLTYYPITFQQPSIPYVRTSHHIYSEKQMVPQFYNSFHHNAAAAQTAPVPAQGMKVDRNNTALVITDPQNDFLSPKGAAWNLVKDSVAENHTIENIELLLKTAKENKFKVFVSPHWYYPYDQKWKFGGVLEHLMHDLKMYQRKSPLSLEGFTGSGADFLDRYKPYIEDGQTVICSPHKIFGPEANDLVLQLRKQCISRVILAGMSGNLCVESHMRELIERGFEVAVVYDATASAKMNGLDGDKAAKINFRMIASASWSTNETINKMRSIHR